jgi:hypothetical protein
MYTHHILTFILCAVLLNGLKLQNMVKKNFKDGQKSIFIENALSKIRSIGCLRISENWKKKCLIELLYRLM